MATTKSQVLIYILKRLLNSIFVLLILSFIIFVFLRAIPGDPVLTLLGEEETTPEQYQELRHALGLDQPLVVQYLKWIGRITRGEFGTSIHTSDPVLPQMLEKLKATIELAFMAVLLGSLFGMFAGTISAVKQNSIFDNIVMFFALFGISIPVFWMGLILIIVFSVQMDWLPISGMLSHDIRIQAITGFALLDAIITGNIAAIKDILGHLVLPAITLGVVPAALTARTTRASMLDVINEDYIKAGLARGLSFWEALRKHAFRNALIPVVTVIGLQIGVYLGGSIVTETVFAWPGLGRHVVNAIYDRDYTVVQGAVFIYAFIIVLVNLVVDLLYSFIDPRVRL
ncbi:MAG: ABC transporter permease [Deltaproteobacteria bacterium]|nr:ABC transporter permease [Deltaproteobacteria bacterium]